LNFRVAAVRRPIMGIGVLLLLVAVTLAVLRITDHSARAEARHLAKACTSKLLADWSDGQIRGTYPIHCYRDALKSLPTDLRMYSSAPDDIAQALSQRIVRGRARTSSDVRTLAESVAAK
jgi:hypothetical protein